MISSADTSPYYDAWVRTAARDYERALAAVEQRDFEALAEVAEHSCLKMHALMLATRPPLTYWNPLRWPVWSGYGNCARRVPRCFSPWMPAPR